MVDGCNEFKALLAEFIICNFSYSTPEIRFPNSSHHFETPVTRQQNQSLSKSRVGNLLCAMCQFTNNVKISNCPPAKYFCTFCFGPGLVCESGQVARNRSVARFMYFVVRKWPRQVVWGGLVTLDQGVLDGWVTRCKWSGWVSNPEASSPGHVQWPEVRSLWWVSDPVHGIRCGLSNPSASSLEWMHTQDTARLSGNLFVYSAVQIVEGSWGGVICWSVVELFTPGCSMNYVWILEDNRLSELVWELARSL